MKRLLEVIKREWFLWVVISAITIVIILFEVL